MDRRFWFTTAAALLAGLALTTAQAARTPVKTFAQLDTNGDGYISKDEAAGDPNLADPDHWAKYDENKDGKIDKTEYEAYTGKHAPKKQ